MTEQHFPQTKQEALHEVNDIARLLSDPDCMRFYTQNWCNGAAMYVRKMCDDWGIEVPAVCRKPGRPGGGKDER
jgi:uncharacterized protein YecA (UPF0149 family)